MILPLHLIACLIKLGLTCSQGVPILKSKTIEVIVPMMYTVILAEEIARQIVVIQDKFADEGNPPLGW